MHNDEVPGEVAAVILELLWIFGCYAAAVLAAQAIVRRSAGAGRYHYVLVAGNHEAEIEGCVRALQRYSRRTGKDIGITVVLDGSTDETGAIVERFARGSEGIGIVRSDRERVTPWAGEQEVVRIDLGIREHVARLPLWRRW